MTIEERDQATGDAQPEVKERKRAFTSIRIPKSWIDEMIDPLVELGAFESRPDAVERTILRLLRERDRWPKKEGSLTIKVREELIAPIREALGDDADEFVRGRLHRDLEKAWKYQHRRVKP